MAINGCDFSAHEPLLATACGDGYVRVYDIRSFQASSGDGTAAATRTPTQIGKFSVSKDGLFRITFHHMMRNVLGVTCDSGEVKIFRYEYDGKRSFKVQCAATLTGHLSNSRPIVFHSEIPSVVITGSWDGSVAVWDWVQNQLLWKY